jgi:hypothetical protein
MKSENTSRAGAMMSVRKADVVLLEGGPVVLLYARTERAYEWLQDNLPDDCLIVGINYVLQRSHASDMLAAMQAAGLKVARQGRH